MVRPMFSVVVLYFQLFCKMKYCTLFEHCLWHNLCLNNLGTCCSRWHNNAHWLRRKRSVQKSRKRKREGKKKTKIHIQLDETDHTMNSENKISNKSKKKKTNISYSCGYVLCSRIIQLLRWDRLTEIAFERWHLCRL